MRRALIALALLAACTEEDSPRGFHAELGGASMSVFGIREFSPEEIAAGIKPSPAIMEMAGLCKNARFKTATSDTNNPKRVNYYFACDPS